MRFIRTVMLVATAASLMGCQSGKLRNPLAFASKKEAPYSEAELAAVEDVVDRETKPVSFTGQLTQTARSRPSPAPQRSFSTRRS